MIKNLVSIVLPVFNGEKFLSESIESCLSQTYSNIELIIVNDCSTDSSIDIINEYLKQDIRIRLINNKINKKLPASLNIGHRAARGEFLTWTSDDNIYNKDAIEVLYNNLNKVSVDFVYSDMIQINELGNVTREFFFPEKEELLWRNIVGACFMYKKRVYDNLKGYDETYFLIEDYHFWYRVFLNFKVKKINLSLYKYRIHDKSLTTELSKINSEKQIIFTKNKERMISELFKENRLPSFIVKQINSFQLNGCIDCKDVYLNYKKYIEFYSRHSQKNFSDFSNHMRFLFNKLVISVRGNKSNQKKFNSFFMFKIFYKYINFNDFKTIVKIFLSPFIKV